MLVRWTAAIWRRVPKRVRRWGVLLTETRFTVTTGAIVLNQAGEVLLLQHRFRPSSGWGIPGGFLQRGEQPLEALQRELREEIGVTVTEAELAFVRTLKRYQQVECIFRCRINREAIPQTHEISRAAWFALDVLPEGLSDDQRALIQTAITSETDGNKGTK
jgi:8-oxo-dGTP diphosphatase